jgi:hypothetical protein
MPRTINPCQPETYTPQSTAKSNATRIAAKEDDQVLPATKAGRNPQENRRKTETGISQDPRSSERQNAFIERQLTVTVKGKRNFDEIF